ncbi:MAG: lamin tail domain-containing protein, partial [Bacteroidia bacterium]|nr:lamin tail domain-containing protein [Bacteroidia bacterium]
MKYKLYCVYLVFFCKALYAQVSDDFSDGNFTSSPAWVGDVGNFIVNSSFQLQSNASTAGSSSLATANTSINNTEWNVWIRFAFSPSTSNFCRFYLVSNQSDLKTPLNGYYVQLGGSTGSTDTISLYRQTGSVRTRIIAGIPGTVAKSNNLVRLKVTRDNIGNWELLADTTGTGAYFVSQGTAFDNTHTTTSYVGWYCQYTISNATKFYLDDLYVGPIIVDTTPPELLSATVVSPTEIDLLFNENLKSSTTNVPTNYSISGGIGTPASANLDFINPKLVHLTLSSPLTPNVTYTVTCSNIQDLAGNTIGASNSANFMYVVPELHDVIITEIMADPDPPVGLPNAEYVEIFNRSTKTFNLAGWKFSDNTSTVTLSAYTLSAGQRLILCSPANTAALSTFGSTLGVSSFPSLNNTGETLTLRDNNGNIIHRVTYSDSWYKNDAKKNGGYSLEMIDTNFPCVGFANWIASTHAQGGTPGQINSVNAPNPDNTAPSVSQVTATSLTTLEVVFNEPLDSASAVNTSHYFVNLGIGSPVSVAVDVTFTLVTLTFSTQLDSMLTYQLTVSGTKDCSGNITNQNVVFQYPRTVQLHDVIITEIMADPDPPVGLPNAEYVEIFNRSTKTFNLAGWKFSDNTSTVTLSAYTLSAGQRLILCSPANTAALSTFGSTLGVSSFPSLNNTGETLTLRDNNGNIIHRVTYSDSWYKNDAKKNGGYSLEMIDTNFPCVGFANWIASTHAQGGTPGQINSVNAPNPDNTAPNVSQVTPL